MQNPVMEFRNDDKEYRSFSKEKALAMLEEHRKKVLAEKAKEYTIEGNNDRLENFKYMMSDLKRYGRGYAISEIIIVLMSKHTASIRMLKHQDYTQAILLEKCGDALNYYDLLIIALEAHQHSGRKIGADLFILNTQVKDYFVFFAEKLHDKGEWHD